MKIAKVFLQKLYGYQLLSALLVCAKLWLFITTNKKHAGIVPGR